MRINKWIIYADLLVCGISVYIVVIFFNNAVALSIGISLLAGSFVSTLTAILYYFYDKDVIRSRVKRAIPELYVNLKIIIAQIDIILPRVMETQDMRKLGFKRLSFSAELNEDCIIDCHLENFCPIIGKSKNNKAVKDFDDFAEKLTKLRYYIVNLEEMALKEDIRHYELLIKRENGEIVSQEEARLSNLKKVQVYKQIEQVREYVIKLLLKLDEIANNLFDSKMKSWDSIKLGRKKTIDFMLKEILKE